MKPMKLKAILEALVNGPYAWPGGYPMYFIAGDGDTLSFDAVQENMEQIARANVSPGRWNRDWQVWGVETNWEDPALFCAHTNKRIPSAYAEA